MTATAFWREPELTAAEHIRQDSAPMAEESISLPSRFDLRGRVAAITGGAGLLGREHAKALLETGAAVALLDVDAASLEVVVEQLRRDWPGRVDGITADVTSVEAVQRALAALLAERQRVDILINNAARDPKVEVGGSDALTRLEDFSDEEWGRDLAVGLTGAFQCARVFGSWMADHGGGVILNIASDLAVIAPDQRLYEQEGSLPGEQPVKPVSYSVMKTGVVGLTRYLATYWANRGVRANSLSPGGIRTDQPDAFVSRLVERVPLGRMAAPDEYRGAVQFLCSDASAYVNGHNLVMDGGRSVW